MDALGQSISIDRQRLGLSQQELAERLGVTQQSVSKWEEGLAHPRGKRLTQLVSALGGTASQTASLVSAILPTPRTKMGTENMMHTGAAPTQAEALMAIAHAAAEIARAAQALAESVAAMSKEPHAQRKH